MTDEGMEVPKMDRRTPKMISRVEGYFALVTAIIGILYFIGTPMVGLRDDVRDLKTSNTARVATDAQRLEEIKTLNDAMAKLSEQQAANNALLSVLIQQSKK